MSWDTEKVYPLVYGDGENDVIIRSIKGWNATGDMLLGGQSFTNQTNGEGFVMRVNKHGAAIFVKLVLSESTTVKPFVLDPPMKFGKFGR